MEIKVTKIIEAVSKPDGKSFRQEMSMSWGAKVAACPDANGISAGSGKTKVVSKTTYTESGVTTIITNDFDVQAKLTGKVNDEAKLTHYDLQADAYLTTSGAELAFERNLMKEVKVRDGRYGIHFDIPGNTIEQSDGTYGGKRTPAKIGKIGGRDLTPMPQADVKNIGAAIGSLIPALWTSANEMYKTAEKNWRNYGCVEVKCQAPKTTLKSGEEVVVSAETVHLQDGSRINAEMKAEAFGGQVTPEEWRAKPSADFTFTQESEESSILEFKSTSKRGIGKGEVEFQIEREKVEPTENAVWTGTITAEREASEKRETRSGANLAENGGYLETKTNVRLQLTGKLDRTVDATNAHLANVTGEQVQVDYEYDRYKVDEGYCGPNAAPYKGPKEITRTSKNTANYAGQETRVFLEIGSTRGSLNFSLPEITGRTVHSYVHKSPCADHDRANTNEAIDEDAPTVGGNFSVTFSIEPGQKTIKGTFTANQEGSITVYTWELTRQ